MAKRTRQQVLEELVLALVDHAKIYDGVLTTEVETLAKELRGEESAEETGEEK